MKHLITAAILAIAPLTAHAEDNWTGFHVGLQAGHSNVTSAGPDLGNATLGLHAGYLHDFGRYVLGGELAYDAGAEMQTGGRVQKADTLRLKLKGGYDFGRTLVYGVVGAARLDASSGTINGHSVGLGAAYAVSERVILGAEYLHDSFDSNAQKTKADTVSLRLSYKF